MIDKKYEIHFAPLQGLTDGAFRRLHSQIYGGIDYYYTPFVRIEHGDFRRRDLREIAEDEMPNTIWQVLPGSGEELLRLCEPLLSSGKRRIDINVGCPFPPIMAHGRGATLLNNPDRLADVLSATHQLPSDTEVSLKMRLGYDDPYQWKEIIDIVNEARLAHVCLHARFAKQQYKGTCDTEAFGDFANECKHPLLYNGDIRTASDAEKITTDFPSLKGIMIGRGLIVDMLLATRLRGQAPSTDDEINLFAQMHEALCASLAERYADDRQVVSHMQPFWEYFYVEADHKLRKVIKKAHTLSAYNAATGALIGSLRQNA